MVRLCVRERSAEQRETRGVENDERCGWHFDEVAKFGWMEWTVVEWWVGEDVFVFFVRPLR